MICLNQGLALVTKLLLSDFFPFRCFSIFVFLLCITISRKKSVVYAYTCSHGLTHIIINFHIGKVEEFTQTVLPAVMFTGNNNMWSGVERVHRCVIAKNKLIMVIVWPWKQRVNIEMIRTILQ